jgi:hypothetical protein
MEPLKKPVSFAFISRGSSQLFVGPASDLRREQMKVRSSTRATSLGSDSARKQLGRLAGFSRWKVPASTICPQSRSYSSWEPSHQWMASGWHSAAISSIQASALELCT